MIVHKLFVFLKAGFTGRWTIHYIYDGRFGDLMEALKKLPTKREEAEYLGNTALTRGQGYKYRIRLYFAQRKRRLLSQFIAYVGINLWPNPAGTRLEITIHLPDRTSINWRTFGVLMLLILAFTLLEFGIDSRTPFVIGLTLLTYLPFAIWNTFLPLWKAEPELLKQLQHHLGRNALWRKDSEEAISPDNQEL